MARKYRPVADRKRVLQPGVPKADLMIGGIRDMYTGVGGREFKCIINNHCRTLIYEFPRSYLGADGDGPRNGSVYGSLAIRACITSDLVDFFENASHGRHYAIIPSLRHRVGETDVKTRPQNSDRVPVFLVIEEENELTPVEMIKGECCIWDEILLRDGKKTLLLVGGRENEKFVTAWATADGAWPTIPNNQHVINMILAAVRVAQQSSDPIRKYVDESCLVTDEGRYVTMSRPTASARMTTTNVMDATIFRSRVTEIRKAIAEIENDISLPHIALLINSMYSDERKDDSYQRLHYLRLWQSMVEAGTKCLSYHGNIREDEVVVAGKRTLRELTNYRDDIAHWWTDTIDENYLADLQQTINELIRRKYFHGV